MFGALGGKKMNTTDMRVKMKRCHTMIAIFSVIIIFAIILLGSSMHAFANSKENQPIHKFYTSIQVDSGDTLWEIAKQYKPEGISTKAYVKEISTLNRIDENSICTGNHIVIFYYGVNSIQ